MLLSASEAFSQHNTNVSISGMLATLKALVPAAREKGLSVRGYLSAVWGCPYELSLIHIYQRLERGQHARY